MELKVGMYIRTRDENISKIKYINKFIYTDKQRYGKHYIEKASENIIDLIEVGDYVNGYLVTFVYRPDGNEVFGIELEKNILQGHIISKSEQIKSIVTKEAFKANEYRVETN